MTRPRSTSSPSDALGATIANQSARTASLETVAHRHARLFGRGVVAIAQDGVGTRITGITSIVDVPSLSVQFIADPTRLYRVTASLGVLSSVAGDVVRCFLTTDTDVQLKQASTEYLLANQGTQLHLEHLMTGSGLTSLKLRVLRQVGSGSVSVLRDLPIFNNFLVVEDIAGLPSPYVIAGGAALDTFITVSGTVYRVISFTGNGELQVLNGDISDMEYLVVGGGGGGGFNGRGGGGGAGGFLTNLGLPISAVSSGIYPVQVGNGGPISTTLAVPSFNGGDSSVFGITAFGGGGGGSRGVNFVVAEHNARDGASGGGGSNGVGGVAGLGGSGITGQGFGGGVGTGGGEPFPSGGGGGASQVGVTPPVAGRGGNGGNGLTTTIRGVTETFAGGGGGGDRGVNTGRLGFGGAGGGGNGATSQSAAIAGTNGTGGGGGGASDQFLNGGTGGSGIVIVRFPYSPTQFQS
jgi:hypothetical protein